MHMSHPTPFAYLSLYLVPLFSLNGKKNKSKKNIQKRNTPPPTPPLCSFSFKHFLGGVPAPPFCDVLRLNEWVVTFWLLFDLAGTRRIPAFVRLRLVGVRLCEKSARLTLYAALQRSTTLPAATYTYTHTHTRHNVQEAYFHCRVAGGEPGAVGFARGCRARADQGKHPHSHSPIPILTISLPHDCKKNNNKTFYFFFFLFFFLFATRAFNPSSPLVLWAKP